MERYIVISLLIFFGTTHGQDDREVNYLDPNIEYEDDYKQQQANQLQEVKITKHPNHELLPGMQRLRRNLEDSQEFSTKNDIIEEINNLKEQLEHLQRSEILPYHEKKVKIMELKKQLQKIIDLLQSEQAETEEQITLKRTSLNKDGSEKCKDSKAKKDSFNKNRNFINQQKFIKMPMTLAKSIKSVETEESTPEIESIITHRPNPKKHYYKTVVVEQNTENVLDNIIPSQKPKNKIKFLNHNRNKISQFSRSNKVPKKEVSPEPEDPDNPHQSDTNETNNKIQFFAFQPNNAESMSNELRNALTQSKNVKCFRTAAMIVCAGFIN